MSPSNFFHRCSGFFSDSLSIFKIFLKHPLTNFQPLHCLTPQGNSVSKTGIRAIVVENSFVAFTFGFHLNFLTCGFSVFTAGCGI